MSKLPHSVPRKKAKRGPSSGKDAWQTPTRELVLINRLFGGHTPDSYVDDLWYLPDPMERHLRVCAELRDQGCISMDPCAGKDSDRHFARENMSYTGLTSLWSGNTFVNPPYSGTAEWVQWAARQSLMSNAFGQCLFLIPPSLCTAYWIDHLLKPKDTRPANVLATSRGRLAFIGDTGPVKGNTLGSAVVGWMLDPHKAGHMLDRAGWVSHGPG